MAPSSAKAISRAASLTGCQSASVAPRSTSSIAWRSSSNGTRSSTSAFTSRWRAITPSAGAAMSRRWPVPTAERAVPTGPCTSTTRRPARNSLSVRDASSSIWAHAISETGASSRCRLFILTVSFEGADAERTVTRGRAWLGLRGGGTVRRHFLEESRGRHEEKVAGHCPAEVEQPVVIARRTADEHVLEHLLDGARRPAVADEIGAELAP